MLRFQENVEQNDPSLSDDPSRGPDLSEEFARLRAPLVRYFERATNDPTEAHDLTQEVFTRLVQRGALSDYERFQGYAFDTARSVLIDRHRRRATRQQDRHVEFDADLHAGVEPGPEAMFIARESLQAMDEALRKLPEKTRAVFVLRRLEGLSYGEIAQRLGVSVSAVEKQMLRATRYLIASSRESE